MLRRSLLSAFLALASSSVGALGQQNRPQDPYYQPTASGGFYSAPPTAYSPSGDGRNRDIQPAQYAADERSMGNNDIVWVPPRQSQSQTSAEASRAVAEQLRQQYSGPAEMGRPVASAPQPHRPQFSGEYRPTYRPVPTAEPTYPIAGPNQFGPPAESARYRQPARYDEPYYQDTAPSYPPGQSNQGTPAWPSPVPSPPASPHHVTGLQHYPMGGPGCDSGCDPYDHDGRNGWGLGSHGGRGLTRGRHFYDDCGPDGSCGPNGYFDGRSGWARAWNRGCRDMYTIVGARWLNMRRDGADYKSLSYEGPMPSMTLLVEDANSGYQSGIEVFFVRQDQNGRGWEGRYWGLPSQAESAALGNMPMTQLTGLGMLDIGPWGTVGGLYNIADYHQVTRSSELHSFELNFINHASTCGTGKWLYRGLMGARVIRFRDRLDYSAHSGSNFGFDFDQVTYGLLTRNTFVGAQAGGSGEYCVTNKLRLAVGATAGVGKVFMDADQVIETSTGVRAVHSGGGTFSYMNSDDDLSVFGEFDLRGYYHLSQNWRLSCGYRLLGISGLALAHQQIPYAFNRTAELESIKRDGGLILHGLTLGAEFSY